MLSKSETVSCYRIYEFVIGWDLCIHIPLDSVVFHLKYLKFSTLRRTRQIDAINDKSLI